MATRRARAPKATAPRRRAGQPRSRTALVKLARALGASSRNVSPEQKAVYHHVTGAGRSRVKREFFDVNASDLDAMAAVLEQRMQQHLTADLRRL